MEKTTPANTGRNQAGRFLKGQSGNPDGKTPGTRHKATQAALTLLDGETEALTRKAVELALEGDTTALKLCLDRIAPPLKANAQSIDLCIPPSNSLTGTARALVEAASNGHVPPDIAAQMVSAIAGVAKVEEMESIKERLEALEKILKDRKV